MNKNKKRILLHSCCGPCSTSVIERLLEDFYVTVYFYNPNIVNETEYNKRLEAQKKVIDYFLSKQEYIDLLELMEGPYEPEVFINNTKGMENEREGGGRCSKCFDIRLEKTAAKAKASGFDIFATTLTVSPHKNYDVIRALGNEIADKYEISYYDENFRKKDGFTRSIALSKEIDIYRQNFCGCRFSVWDEEKNLGIN